MKSLLEFWIAMSVTLGVAMPSHADTQSTDASAPVATTPAALAVTAPVAADTKATTAPSVAVPAVTAPAAAKPTTVAPQTATPPPQKATSAFRPKKQTDLVRHEANKAIKEITDVLK